MVVNSKKLALLFPGQGSQRIGMGQEMYSAFPEAKNVIDMVDDALSISLSSIMFRGDKEALTETFNTQPAIMAASMAVWEVVKKNLPDNITKEVTAGHSVGEYSAICASGVFNVAETAKMLRVRGMAMQQAVPQGLGGMVAVLGANENIINAIVKDIAVYGRCEVANDNGGGQFVLSGDMSAVTRVLNSAEKYGAKRAVMLNVSAPFHSTLMAPATVVMSDEIRKYETRDMTIPIISNYTADAVKDKGDLRDLLIKQVEGRVRWAETMDKMKDEYKVDIYLELGCGNVLSNLLKRHNPSAVVYSVHSPQELDAFMEYINSGQ